MAAQKLKLHWNLVEMQSPVAAAEVKQRIQPRFEGRLLHFADQDEMVASLMDGMARAFEYRERIHQYRYAVLAHAPRCAAKAVLDPGRESDRGWLLLGLELDVGLALMLLYVVLLALLAGMAVAYYELVLPHLTPRGATPSRQVLELALLTFGLFVTVFLFSLFVERDRSFDDLWWQGGGPVMLLGLALGVVVYATTAVYGRVLATAVVPSQRRDAS